MSCGWQKAHSSSLAQCADCNKLLLHSSPCQTPVQKAIAIPMLCQPVLLATTSTLRHVKPDVDVVPLLQEVEERPQSILIATYIKQ
jgi:hypothetical protein